MAAFGWYSQTTAITASSNYPVGSAWDWFFHQLKGPRRGRRRPLFDYRVAVNRAHFTKPAPDHGWTYMPEQPRARLFYRTKTRPSVGGS